MKPLYAMTHDEFMAQPFERWAEVLAASGHFLAGAAAHWLKAWEGRYATEEAKEDARRGGRGWVWCVEWSTHTWRYEIRKALARGDEVPPEVLREYSAP